MAGQLGDAALRRQIAIEHAEAAADFSGLSADKITS
jgi:hypothetical protein